VRDVPEDFHTQVGPRLEELLAPGETLEGLCAATRQSAFRGGMAALAVTDRRLVVQPLDRHAQPKGDGLLGRLGGGDGQQAGLVALATWVRRHHPER
jgi:hypothetical protein